VDSYIFVLLLQPADVTNSYIHKSEDKHSILNLHALVVKEFVMLPNRIVPVREFEDNISSMISAYTIISQVDCGRNFKLTSSLYP
jgi:hypothetical protein